MRVKIHTVAPLTERKVLLPVDGHVTIAQLTERVCDSVLTDDRPISPEQLALEVDGFELLADSTTAVLEKSDIVTVRLRPSSSGTTRAADSPPADIPSTKRAKSGSARVESSSSSSSSESESESDADSSSESSESESETESESGSSSDSSSSSGVSPPATNPAFPTYVRSTGSVAPTPPFQGKASTHERNARRRRAKQMRKLAAAGVFSSPAGVDDPAVMSRTPALTVTPTSQFLPVPRTMDNRNKKKGFLQEMLKVQGTKTVFHDSSASGTQCHTPPSETPVERASGGTTVNPSPSQSRAVVPVPSPAKLRSPPPTPIRVPEPIIRHLVPPSEHPSLPNNVFVTSREFEFMTDNERRKRDAAAAGGVTKRRRKETDTTNRNGAMVAAGGQNERGTENGWDRTQQGLPYGDDHETMDVELSADTAQSRSALHDHVQKKYDSLPLLELSSVSVGSMIAWKDVVLDIATFSPQVKILVGRITSLDGSVIVEHIGAPEDEMMDGEEGDGEEVGPLSEAVDLAAREYRSVG